MTKNYGKYRTNNKPPSGVLSRLLLVMVLTLFICGIALLAYQSKSTVSGISSYYGQAVAWVTEHKQHLHQGLTKVKQLSAPQNDADQQIHFEFYTSLPNMSNMKVAEPVTNEKHIAHVAPVAPVPIASPEELERELSAELNKS